MKILHTQTLRGPNHWSVDHSKLLVLRLDLAEHSLLSSDRISAFYEELLQTLPSLEETLIPRGSVAKISPVGQSIFLEDIFAQVALALQRLADMPVEFYQSRKVDIPGQDTLGQDAPDHSLEVTSHNILQNSTCQKPIYQNSTYQNSTYQIAIEYRVESAGRYAARAARRLCQSLLETGVYPKAELQKDLKDLMELRSEESLGPTTEVLIQEAEALGIPWISLEACHLLQFGYGKYQKRIQASLTSHSNILGVELAGHKERTKKVLSSMGAPVPQGIVIYSFRELEDAIAQIGGYPVVIKPLDGNHGRGITLDIQSWQQAEVAYDRARDVSRGVIVEHFYQGRDHRILVVNHKVVAVAERVPAHVIGNGKETITALVRRENQDARRGKGHDNLLTRIELDDAADETLSRQGYTLDTVLLPGQVAYLRATANLSTGGIAIDRTDEIHPETRWLAERVSRIIDLDIAGIDVVTTDITQPLRAADGVIVEVNAAPGLRMHVAPSQGKSRNVAAPILKMLFPPDTPTRIPIVAVTGSNGKAAPTPLMAHILKQIYGAVGFTTADSVYISDRRINPRVPDAQAQHSEMDHSKAYHSEIHHHTQLVLQDPTVEVAVLQTTPESILETGLAFAYCDVGVVLNVAADQLGTGNIHTLDYRATVNAVIAKAVHSGGYVILNADDERVAAMAGQVRAKVAYFSMHPENPLLRSHVSRGGIAAVYDQGWLVLWEDACVHRIENVSAIPHTVGGATPYLIANALAACLTAFVQGVSVAQIRAALHSFQPLVQSHPGQLQLFNFAQNFAQSPFQSSFDLRKLFPESSPATLGNGSATNGQASHVQPVPAESLSNSLKSAIAPSNGGSHYKDLSYQDLTLLTANGNGHPQNGFAQSSNVQAGDVETNGKIKGQRPLKVDPLKADPLANSKQARIAEMLPKVIAAEEALTATFKKALSKIETIKRRGIQRSLADQSAKAKTWVEAQAPVARQFVTRSAHRFAEQVVEQGIIAGTIALALGQTAVGAATKKGKALGKNLGAIAWRRFKKATQLVDPSAFELALAELTALLGKDERIEKEGFIFQGSAEGVNVYLEDGTPLCIKGILQASGDSRLPYRLGKMQEAIALLKGEVLLQSTAQDGSKQLVKR